ncbi:MAG: amino acid adenylation domain-containing protein, partial [bacterium]|nr:amino acid adenylation domain-containing protein [bacterium]
LRRLLVGVEPIPERVLVAIREGIPGLRIINGYGPTEATVCCTLYNVGRRGQAERTTPLGRALRNTAIYLLDRTLRPVPCGAAGELAIGGHGLARGYQQRPSLTAERFIPDPWSERAGSRLYRTGDLVRALPAGELMFQGRIDHQVKIRGFRIELGEIEAALGRHPTVREAVVLAREDGPGRAGSGPGHPAPKRVVAYLVAEAAGVKIAELREVLKRQLPEYMVPEAWVELAELPLDPNGKVDRRALPAPAWGRDEDRELAAPRTPVEEMLAGVWSELLGVEAVGIDDDFFELGGHSLLGTQLISRVRETFRLDMPLRQLFETPTVAGLSEVVEKTRAAERDAVVPPLRPIARQGDALPLSFAQERLWFLERFEPEAGVYNESELIYLGGRLAVAGVEAALSEIARRHATLRTTFAQAGGEAVQRIAAAAPLRTPVVDLRALPAARRRPAALRLVHREVLRAFDLARGPLMRALLVRLGDEEHLLSLSMHHIVCDGWSMGILFHELTTLYRVLLAGEPSPLEALPVQYADYAVWQRQWLRGEVLEARIDYWKRQLGGAPTALDLPTDRPRPARQSFRGRTLAAHLPETLTREVEALSRRRGATLYMTLLAAFKVLLGRWSGQTDVLVGTPIANRTRVEIEGLIGFFINTLVLRTDLSGDSGHREPTFEELLKRVVHNTLGAYEHQDLPFERLVEELQPPRDLSRHPLFQVMFQLQNAPAPPVELPDVTLGRVPAEDSETAKFDVGFFLAQSGAGLAGPLEYSTDLFDRSTMERLLRRYRTLLAEIVAGPGRRLSDLPLLAPAELHQLLAEWNDTAAHYPREVPIHEQVEARVERIPEAVALVFEDRRMSYRELDVCSNRLANHLRALGVGPEVTVGIALERSPELVVAVLAVFKAGGLFVALNRLFPEERLAFMLRDAEVKVLLADRESLAFLPRHDARTVMLDADREVIARQSARRPSSGVRADNLAYLIFTSGTTGRPKAISMVHRALSNLIQWQLRSTGPDAGLRILQYAPLSFDVCFQEIFSALCSGGSVFLLPEEVRVDPVRLAELLETRKIRQLFLPFVALQQLTEAAGESPPSALREVITAGEQLQISPQVERFFTALASGTLENQYGPSECHVVTFFTLRGAAAEWPALPPVGRAVANFRIYLLNARGKPVPVGIPGEVYLNGPAMARGYFNRPELTAASFLPDPFSLEAGDRLYRTGDLARTLGDGNLVFLGRIDHQVKIRGFRIEPGEIEAVLDRGPRVRESVVVAFQESPLRPARLVAYVVTADPRPEVEALRAHLKEKLPDYMVPSAFVFLDALPLTSGGKVDRRALPAPEWRHDEMSDLVAPRTQVEELLADVWAEILGLDRVGVDDNFFELGGHSLLATQVTSRVREAFGVELPLRRLFEAPTVGGLALSIQELWEQAKGVESAPIRPVPRDQAPPLSFAQQRLWFLDQLESGTAAYNIPMAVRLAGTVDAGLLESILHHIVRRHEALRTTFAVVADRPVQVIAEDLRLPLPVVDLGALEEPVREAESRRLTADEASRPFDLEAGPLIRATLLRLAQDDHVVLVNMHHIVSDGWSMAVFTRELGVLYDELSRGRSASGLAELPVQYADFAHWQRRWLEGEVLERELAYWRKQLGGAPPRLELPTDRPRPAVQSFRGGGRPFALSRDLSASLAALGRRHGVTMFMTLLAGFQALLAHHTGRDDVSVGSPIAGRTRKEIEGLIGFFINTLVLRTDLRRDPSFRDLLAQVRQVALDGYAHQNLPFERLVEELQPQRDLSTSPLFQVLFVLQNAPRETLELPGLTMTPLEMKGATTKFDLSLGLTEGGAGIVGGLEYSTELFDATTMERLLAHYTRLLEGVVEDPQRRLSELPRLTPGEEHQLLVDWDETGGEAVAARSIHSLFEVQAERTPDAAAVVAGDRRLSYGELDRRADQLASYLRRLGVRPESRVGICLERSAELVVALLGVLKAGGAYVPLDPAYPAERLAFLLEDAGVELLLTQEALIERLPELAVRALDLDRERGTIGAPRRAHPGPTARPDQLAYVIYTSGSTGRPKGVAIAHRSAVAMLGGAREVFSAAELGGVLAATSSCFDLSVFELFAPLAWG